MTTINSINSNIPIEISKGGTNATSLTTSYGTLYYDGSSFSTVASVGASGTVLTSNGAGVAPTFQPEINTLESGFYAYLSGNTSYDKTGNLTWFIVPYDSERFDIGGDFTTGASTKYTAPSTGFYLSIACPVLATSTAGIDSWRNNFSTSGVTAAAGNHDVVGLGNPETMDASTPSDTGDGASGKIAKARARMEPFDAGDFVRNYVRVDGQGSDATGLDAITNGARSTQSGFILGI